MPCGCGGQALTVQVDGANATVTASTPGMPRYRVTTDDGKATEHATYREAMAARAQRPGAKVRAI